ncbi:DUF3574 domain-containing protein [Streptomyces canus]|uniref:DUF3574 domain-containing protein n=1 Tax=Streptomyces canus TaxID=58343 RepID=UPI0009A0F46A
MEQGAPRRRHPSGRIETGRSYELILLYPAGQAAASDRRIEEIRRAYERTFGQEPVGRLDDRARVDF